MTRKNIYTFFTAFALLIAVIVIDRIAFSKMQAFTAQVDHTRDVITKLELLSHHYKSLQVYSEKYAQIGEKEFYDVYKQESEQVMPDVQFIKQLVKDNPEQVKRMDSIERLIMLDYDSLKKYNIAELIQIGQKYRLKDMLETHSMIDRAVESENALLVSRKESLHQNTAFTNLFSILFLLLAAIFIGITFLSNISLRKKGNWLEGLLETILNTSQDGIIYYRALRVKNKIQSFNIIYANPAVNQLLGTGKRSAVINKVPELETFINDANLFAAFEQVVDSGNVAELEILYEKHNNRKWLNIMLAKMEDGVTATFHDITSLKEYQETLQQNIEKLERSNIELEQYAYAASHDLQEPLRKIKLNADKLQQPPEVLSDKQKMSLEKIMQSSERMTVLIRDLLKYSSLKEQQQFEQVDLNITVDNVLQDFDLLISQKNAEIKKGTLPVVEGISTQFVQLFYNLISNALKFSSKERQSYMNIESRELNQEEIAKYEITNPTGFIVVTFSDNGIGFNEEFAGKIFSIFKRLHSRNDYEGSGIGLALVRKVVENHNGYVYAKSRLNEGASFYIILPYKQNA